MLFILLKCVVCRNPSNILLIFIFFVQRDLMRQDGVLGVGYDGALGHDGVLGQNLSFLILRLTEYLIRAKA